MRKFTKLLLATAVFCGMAGNAFAERIEPVTLESSDCHHGRAARYTGDYAEGEDELPMVWTLTYTSGVLKAHLKDVWENCDMYAVYGWAERDGDTITLNFQTGTHHSANCICTYDLDMTFDFIEPGKYKIIFKNSIYESAPQEVEIKEGMEYSYRTQRSAVEGVEADMLSLKVTDGILEATGASEFTLEIFSADGIRHGELKADREASVSLSSLASGIYFVRATAADGSRATLSFVK